MADNVKDFLIVKELRGEKFGIAIAPTAPQTGWAVTNLTLDRTLNADVNDALVLGDVLGQLITDLIAKGIITS